jgi:hypothetical protein
MFAQIASGETTQNQTDKQTSHHILLDTGSADTGNRCGSPPGLGCIELNDSFSLARTPNSGGGMGSLACMGESQWQSLLARRTLPVGIPDALFANS